MQPFTDPLFEALDLSREQIQAIATFLPLATASKYWMNRLGILP